MKLCVTMLVALSLLMTPALASCRQPLANEAPKPKAAIIDQLGTYHPNQAFINQATEFLEADGFTVDVWPGKEVTVDFYRGLPRYGYKLIIFRVHSGILLSVEGSRLVPSQTTYLFTGESYTTKRYVSEQLTDKISNAMMSEQHPLVFAINSQFIADDLNGTFKGSVIIAMGCESSYLDDMATAFIQRGALAYVGWNTVVSLDYVDSATLNLLDNLCLKDMTVAEGIAGTMAEAGTDPFYHTYLKMYPLIRGNQSIKALAK